MDYYGGNDRRKPILWVTSINGLVYDCYSATFSDYDGYQPVLETGSRYFHDVYVVYNGATYQDVHYEHTWAYLEPMSMDELSRAYVSLQGDPRRGCQHEFSKAKQW